MTGQPTSWRRLSKAEAKASRTTRRRWLRADRRRQRKARAAA